jgi:hypothetical protein
MGVDQHERCNNNLADDGKVGPMSSDSLSCLMDGHFLNTTSYLQLNSNVFLGIQSPWQNLRSCPLFDLSSSVMS